MRVTSVFLFNKIIKMPNFIETNYTHEIFINFAIKLINSPNLRGY
ncbi:hypothetical protein GCM10010984_05430 [Chishuiella changwenlii]|uniref:Uncharacterized protein n=1 Tax=Chishuiella changwenlii TaxID=1434701 RepID=A0ABQ1TD05_9FLAO|nr:hypothetical protein GCM10010984_05430 [Chishuiella changwenlii]